MGYSVNYIGEFKTNVPIDAETKEHLEEDLDLVGYYDGNYPIYWHFQDDLQTLEWQGGEKFHIHETWIVDVVEALRARGYTLSGKIQYQGEEIGDCGVIDVMPDCIIMFVADLAHIKFETKILWNAPNRSEGDCPMCKKRKAN
jgi:hypothetical protein